MPGIPAEGLPTVPPGTAYRGRLAPSPTGLLHLGHARTFWVAWRRARALGGRLILRIEDLDAARCRPEHLDAIREDLLWLGLDWDEGPWEGGSAGPYVQSARGPFYADAFRRLQVAGRVYPCACSRRDIAQALSAPHESSLPPPRRQARKDEGTTPPAAPAVQGPTSSRNHPYPAGDEEPVYPGTCRPGTAAPDNPPGHVRIPTSALPPRAASWRFQVQDGEIVSFTDLAAGPQSYVAGRDFGDFVVWRNEGVAAYQLACVVDDHRMGITEVVRGEDLLVSTARQILLYRALGWQAPAFVHCPLVRDPEGNRLAKRHDALSLRRLKEKGSDPRGLVAAWATAGM